MSASIMTTDAPDRTGSTDMESSESIPITPARRDFRARALLVGERIDLHLLEATGHLATMPLAIRVKGSGVAVLFRYGAVVLFDLPPLDEATFLEQLGPYIRNRHAAVETEEANVIVGHEARDEIKGNTIYLENNALERLQIVADVLAKSVMLALYEMKMARNFDRIEPLALELEQQGKIGRHSRELIRHIGGSLLSEHTMVGRVEVSDKPDILWEHPELERLYIRLETEFEIRERHLALDRKLGLIARTAETLLGLLQNQRTLRVEWYVVILIVAEILLTLYTIFLRQH
jgi:uncharacterized Rmd1/YagE family protein